MVSHKKILSWHGKKTASLEDIVPLDPTVIFVGINPSPVSVNAGHYHQGRLGKVFWHRLIKYRILNRVEAGSEDDQLIPCGFGITDIVKRPTRRENNITREDFTLGRKLLECKLHRWNPTIVCFIYKRAAEEFLKTPLTNQSGLVKETTIASATIHLFPSPYASRMDEYRAMMDLKNVIQSV